MNKSKKVKGLFKFKKSTPDVSILVYSYHVLTSAIVSCDKFSCMILTKHHSSELLTLVVPKSPKGQWYQEACSQWILTHWLACINSCDVICEHNKSHFKLSHWGQNKIAAISQTTFWNACSWMEMHEFRSKFHWNLFLRVQLKIFKYWFK